MAQLIPVAQFRKLERFKEHTIDVVVGVIDAKRILKARNLVQRALEIGRGTAHLLDAKNRLTVMSTEMSCPGCGRAFEELDPRLFSFNSPHGACEECGGFGEIWNQSLANRRRTTTANQSSKTSWPPSANRNGSMKAKRRSARPATARA